MASHYGQDPTVLNFAIGKPVQITMKYSEPKPCASGSRFLISLEGNHAGMRTFVSRQVAADIVDLGIRAGEAFWILKHGKDEYQVTREKPETEDERLTRQLSQSVARIPVKTAPAPTAAGSPAPTPITYRQAVETPIAELPALAPATPIAQLPGAKVRTQLEAALCTAVQATHAAQQYARELGSGLTFTSEDVRCMAITLIIGKEQRERGAA